MRFLLDTNAVSEPRRPSPDSGYMTWIADQLASDLAISVLTVGELSAGVRALAAGRRRTALESWLAEGLGAFQDQILPVDLAVVSAWADVRLRHRRAGQTVGAIDELIAATALAHGLTLVSRNGRDFDGAGCDLLSPWAGQGAP